MDIFTIAPHQVTLDDEAAPKELADGAFFWLDATREEVAADPDGWRGRVQAVTGVQIYDPHITDVLNSRHPSHFDSTQDYAMVVFRKLALPAAAPRTEDVAGTDSATASVPPQPFAKLATQPVTFLLLDRALITVHASGSRTIEAARQRLIEYRKRPEGNGNGYGNRLPVSPEDLMLRLLNAMVDQYLELRQPLTTQMDRWQRALLDPRRPFKGWSALLDGRIQLRRLDSLCEEQHDAIQELRDYLIDTTGQGAGSVSRATDLMLVRLTDVIEHITRVLNHTRRLEATIESAVQIHFSAMAHRTSEIVRTLTVITALFMPLTLLTGIFGMNFNVMPLIRDRAGFWITIGAMAVIVVVLLFIFRRRKYLDDHGDDARRI